MTTTNTPAEATKSNETVYRKRDGDPVRVYKDRVVYYPTGVVGNGGRKTERLKGRTLGETEAAVRETLGELAAPHSDELTMFKLMRHYIAHARATNAEEETVSRYRVAFNSLPETTRSSSKPVTALDLKRPRFSAASIRGAALG
ncbi:hypothetical protein QWY28_05495 [Nocardioides sp. SOB77]|uniref:Integrase SAM-like N-terminal domain-containing protein n=1 Tax=Nocardioides oceani TaxID=3058369 RepID=A0ABT8FCG9_9ACTN|nr:hypothetical protein [Nocardioides oceani]MDN4172388.1 hypothetical protein [Nocardioides oceani]